MEQLVLMILRGIVIGVVVSAPMGPVGIYCVQRTLDKGRLSGFYTGVGAAVSDLIYCLLTGFGLSFIEEFINSHRDPIQLLGSIVLIFFGIWVIRKKPDGELPADADHDYPSHEGDILKGFALTFSNPLILFLIIGLFAQFNFVIEGMRFYHYLLGFIGIIGGALGWWWLVTFFVDKLRGHFTRRTMKRINMAIGVIILVFAAVGIFSSTFSMLAAPAAPPEAKSGSMRSAEFRVADTSRKGWTAEFHCQGGEAVVMEVTQVSQDDPFGDSGIDVLRVRVVEYPGGRELADAVVGEGVDPYNGVNSWRVIVSGDRWNVFAGNREYRHVAAFLTDRIPVGSPVFNPNAPGGIEVSSCSVVSAPIEETVSTEADIFYALDSIGCRAVDLAGLYSLLDFEQDDSYARVGGAYRLAVLPAQEDGCYELRYLGGARENAAMWSAGMMKGRLLPTPFSNVFDVEWRDAEGEWMLHDVQAEFDRTAHTLTVKFPYQGSSLRFRKE